MSLSDDVIIFISGAERRGARTKKTQVLYIATSADTYLQKKQ